MKQNPVENKWFETSLETLTSIDDDTEGKEFGEILVDMEEENKEEGEKNL